jgi:hypothetical protein
MLYYTPNIVICTPLSANIGADSSSQTACQLALFVFIVGITTRLTPACITHFAQEEQTGNP